ncbi:hypothetical protein GMORB2_3748 [Geosmithia morbida]|uniref:Something about silencing protein 4 domain-containing protein n=1 Tax=Geosmithia morbida TaxID=1094350 RepID=A0A9P5D7V8_9HYPO|nr:uncharacterized protein GMORB2_3748 [Geosmithia morbida]KAF4124909.1 hypothetical protein GMORB2_3748 [Geosmithia morbida]
MTSVTRSSRRAEGPRFPAGPPPMTRSRPAGAGAGAGAGAAAGGGGGGGRPKRALESDKNNTPIEYDYDYNYDSVPSKKARIAVQIIGQSGVKADKFAPPTPAATTKARAPPSPQSPPSQPPQHPGRQATSAAPSPRPAGALTPAAAAAAAPVAAAAPAQRSQATTTSPHPQGGGQNGPSRSKSKITNGIRHELDRLQPDESAKKEPGRKLRSQEATRFKSELASYFPEYDEVIGNDPKEEHMLNADTPILVLDSNDRHRDAAAPGAHISPHSTSVGSTIRGFGDALYTDVVDAQRIDFSFLDAQHKNKSLDDPLPDSLFQPTHKRAERLERSIRNAEKGRAQHEKDQIIRLLESLQGPDWLRVMGVNGVTETKKKAFEPARKHFIRGCEAIIAKFRNWREAGEAEEKEAEDDDADKREDGDDSMGFDESSSAGDTSEPPSPAKQLREEARARSKLAVAKQMPSPQRSRAQPPQPRQPPSPPREFKSFFAKRGERDSSLNRTRRSGRNDV